MDLAIGADAALSRWVIDSAIDFAILATNLEGRVTAWSVGARHILGWDEQEMLGQSADRIFTPEDLQAGRVAAEMRLALEEGAGNDERWHMRKDGQRFWANGRMTPLRTEDGELMGFVKVLRDRTEQHQAQVALAASDASVRRLLDSTAEGIYAVDRDGYATLCNASLLRMLGFARAEDALGRRLHDLIHHSRPDGTPSPAATCPIYRCAHEGTPAHLTEDVFFRLDGTPLEVEYWATPILRDGEPDGAICTFLDITDRKRADEERRRVEQALQALNETLELQVEQRTAERDQLWAVSEDLLVIADYENRLLRVSPSWTRALGWSETELLATPYTVLVHPEDLPSMHEALGGMRRDGVPVRYETRMLTKGGDWRCIDWQVSPEPGGEHVIGSGRDMTEERARQAELESAQAALRQSQKLEAVGQLTGGVAHDFNNLLTIISSSVDFLQRPALPEDRRRRYLGAIAETVERASKLTSQLLAFARRQPLKPEIFDVNQRIKATADLVRPLIGARMQIEIDSCSPPCFGYADAGQFETALVNLLVNARDAMDGAGQISITVAPTDAIPAVRAHLRRPGHFIAVAVQDTGVGIAPDKLDSIFEPFWTTKAVGKGTGLGLSQVFGFAKQSQGEVEVESTPGGGATFTLYLPRSEALDARQELEPSSAARVGGAGVCVLVVEDNESVGRFSTEMLHDLGYKTTWAANAADALKLLSDDSQSFELVFSDVIMPGMNGIDFAKVVRERYPDLPVVLTSGYSQVLADEGAHGFELVSKPYSVEVLSRALRTVLA